MAVSFFVCAFGRNLVSVTVKTFSHLIYFIKKFYEGDHLLDVEPCIVVEVHRRFDTGLLWTQ